MSETTKYDGDVETVQEIKVCVQTMEDLPRLPYNFIMQASCAQWYVYVCEANRSMQTLTQRPSSALHVGKTPFE